MGSTIKVEDLAPEVQILSFKNRLQLRRETKLTAELFPLQGYLFNLKGSMALSRSAHMVCEKSKMRKENLTVLSQTIAYLKLCAPKK